MVQWFQRIIILKYFSNRVKC